MTAFHPKFHCAKTIALYLQELAEDRQGRVFHVFEGFFLNLSVVPLYEVISAIVPK